MFLLILLKCFLSFNELEVTFLIFQIKTSGFAQSGDCIITKESVGQVWLSPHSHQSPPLAACKFQQYCSILLHLSCDQEKPEAHYFSKTGVLCLLTTQQGDVMGFTDAVSRHCHTNVCVHLLHPLPQAGLGLPEDGKCCMQQPNTPKQKLRCAAFYRQGVEAKSISYSQRSHLNCKIQSH